MSEYTAENGARRPPRRPYRFVSGGPVLTWERRIPGDSRVDQITCSAEWFYGQMTRPFPPDYQEAWKP